MRIKCKKEVIILTLGILIAVVGITNYIIFNDQNGTFENKDENKLKSLKKSAGYFESFIHIDGSILDNWSNTALNYDWCSGNGSWSNPYIIENVTIDAISSPTGQGIFIDNSKVDFFIIKNCKIFNAFADNGILLRNTDNGTLLNNTCSTNSEGIQLNNNCNNNTISENIVNTHTGDGIYLVQNNDNNTIFGNTVYISGGSGIYLNNLCNGNNISGNTVHSNGGSGIDLDNGCTGNIISGNTAYDNSGSGIDLDNGCDSNNISGNTVYSNSDSGIYLTGLCNNNTIAGNNASDNLYGIYLENNCNDNTVSGNIANDNVDAGIYLISCDNNIIWGNTIGTYNQNYGIYIDAGSDNNTIIKNVMHYNYIYGMFITSSCYSNLIYLNEFKNQFNARDDGNNQWDNGTIGNYWDDYEGVDADDNGIGDTPYDVPPAGGSVDNFPIWEDGIDLGSLYVEVFDQIFTEESFNITFFIHNSTNFGIEFASVQVWWNGVNVSADVQNFGNGYYFISLDPITVAQGEDPILLKIIISASGYADKYFEIYILVHPSDLVKDTLEFEMIDQSLSKEQFNITFFIYNTTGDGIVFATFKIWWNGIDVSADVQNLGNGYYFISLDPITVTQGEDPILLKMIISASGYEDKQFETYLAVDPDTLEKEIGKGAEGIPLVIILIAIILTAALIVAVTATVVLLRKRK
ncbi:MAG: nitrous oxide reductase family maturation protein NosD [Promethearchaeota archaeon]